MRGRAGGRGGQVRGEGRAGREVARMGTQRYCLPACLLPVRALHPKGRHVFKQFA